MRVRHFAALYIPGFPPKETIIEMQNEDVKSIILPSKKIFEIKTYDIVSEYIDYNGSKILMTSKPLNLHFYKIGKFIATDEMEEVYGANNPHYRNCVRNDYLGVCDNGYWQTSVRNEKEFTSIISPEEMHYNEDEHN